MQKIRFVTLPLNALIELMCWSSCFDESIQLFKKCTVCWKCTKVRNLLGCERFGSSRFVFVIGFISGLHEASPIVIGRISSGGDTFSDDVSKPNKIPSHAEEERKPNDKNRYLWS